MAKTREDFESDDEVVPLPDIPEFEDAPDEVPQAPEPFEGDKWDIPTIPPMDDAGFEFIQLPPPVEFHDEQTDAPKPVEASNPFDGLPPIQTTEWLDNPDLAPPELSHQGELQAFERVQFDDMPAMGESSPSDGVGQKLDSVLGQIAESLQKSSTGDSGQAVPDELATQIETLNGLLREMTQKPAGQQAGDQVAQVPSEAGASEQSPIVAESAGGAGGGPDGKMLEVLTKISDSVEQLRDMFASFASEVLY
jgi:hypothetical protein